MAITLSETIHSSYISILRWRAEHQQHKLAYVYLEKGEQESERLTYASLDQKVRSISTYLQQQNAEKQRVLLLFESDLNYACGFLACNYTNAVAVTLHPPARKKHLQRIRDIAKDSQAGFALTTRQIYDTIHSDIQLYTELKDINWICIDSISLELANHWQQPQVQSSDLAMLQYTSGSTSVPRGVVLTHFNLMYQGEYIRNGFQLTDQEVMVTWLPHFHDLGLFFGILQPLYQGFPCYVMTPLSFLKKPMRWLRAISKYGGTVTAGPNFSFDLCIETFTEEREEHLDLSSWTIALNGAEPIRKSTIEKFVKTFDKYGFVEETFHPAYGMAEVTLVISCGYRGQRPSSSVVDAQELNNNRVVFVDDNNAHAREVVSSGRTWMDVEVKIANPESLQICSTREVGEIFVRGKGIAQGYWQNSQKTQQQFQVFLEGEGPFLRTGDLGFVDDNDFLYVTGRHKDLIIIRGQNYYPQDIEYTVEQSHTEIRPSYVGSFSIEKNDEELLVIIAEIKQQAVDSFDASQVAQAIFQSVVKEHNINVYEVVFSKKGYFPKTTSGKVQRSICKSDYLNQRIEEICNVKNKLYQ